MPLEPRLRAHLKRLFETYAAKVGGAYSTISARVSGDARFYDNLCVGKVGFTVKRYDIIVANFSNAWPDDLPWPEGIERTRLEDLPTRAPRTRNKAARA